MNKIIHNQINNEYEKKRKLAYDDLMSKKDKVYLKVPELQTLDEQIQRLGIKYNKEILLGNSPAHEIVNELLHKIDQLKMEKQRLLSEAGYAADYLEIVYQCPKCQDTGYNESSKGAEKCACYRQQLINHIYSQSNLRLTETENFSLFDEKYYPNIVSNSKYGIDVSPRQNILHIKERSLRFIENFESPDEKNLFFSGPTGIGKTFMANCIATELLNSGKTVLYQTSPRLFDTINEYKRKSFKGEDYQDTSYSNIFEVDLLIIDDLGTESPSAARYAELLTILNTRQLNNLSRPCKTIISTNIGARKLHEYYDERVASRIMGCFDMFLFVGEDIRRLKKLSGK